MKKLFTLMSLLLLAVGFTTASAVEYETIFHWQYDGETIQAGSTFTATGGSVLLQGSANGSTESAAYNAAVTDDEMKSNGGKGLKLGTSTLYLEFTLTKPLKAGDIIRICGYNPYLVGTTVSGNKAGTELSSSLVTGTSKSDYNIGEITVPETIGASANKLYISRQMGTGTGFAAIKILREKEDVSGLPKANISWSVNEVSYKVREANIPEAPTFNNSENFKVSFNSTDPEIASVDESGNVTLSSTKEGTAIVSATFAGNESYAETTETVVVTVLTNVVQETKADPSLTAETVTVDEMVWTAEKTSGDLVAGTLVEGDMMTITTPFKSKYVNYGGTYMGYTFKGAAQLGRSKNAPSDSDFSGGDNGSDNSPMYITPKQDMTLVVYGRRQSVEVGKTTEDNEADNVITETTFMGASTDSKTLFFVDQADITKKLPQTIALGEWIDGKTEYMRVAVSVDLKAGHTYTAYTTGTTYNVNGIGYIIPKEEGAVELDKAIADAKAIDWDLYSEETAKALADAIKAAEELLAQDSPESSALAEAKTKIEEAKSKLSSVEQVIPAGEHTYVFYNWSEATVANLKADAAAGADKGWSDDEKNNGTTVDNKCFWLADNQVDKKGYLLANSEVIAETEGLQFISDAFARNLAIAVNYPETSLGSYNGGAYLWLGGSGKNYFVIKNVKAGSVIKMGVESHKPSEGRGVELYVTEDGSSHSGNKLVNQYGYDVTIPTTYKNSTWQVPGEDGTVDIMVYNTNGCHIYYIDVESAVEAELEYSASEATVTIGEESYELPKLSNPNELEVTYKSSNSDVAEISEEGVVTIKAHGTTVISATSEANEKYLAGEASYTLTVIDPSVVEVNTNLVYNGNMNDFTFTDQNGEVVTNGYSGGIVYNGVDLGKAMYKVSAGKEYTLTAPKGKVMTDVKVIAFENNDTPSETTFISVFAGAEYTIENAAIPTGRKDNKDFTEIKFDVPSLNAVTFKTAGKETDMMWEVTYIDEEHVPAIEGEGSVTATMGDKELPTDGETKVVLGVEDDKNLTFTTSEGLYVYYNYTVTESAESANIAQAAAVDLDETITYMGSEYKLYTEPVKLTNSGILRYFIQDTNKSVPVNSNIVTVEFDINTGVENVTVDVKNDGVIYNVYGQRVNENYRGVVIKNGQKYIQK